MFFRSLFPASVAGLASVLAACAPSPEVDLLIRHVTIIDVERGSVLDNQRVAISDGKFVEIRPENDRPPPASEIVEARGLYLMPGLWDMHTHVSKARGTVLPQLVVAGVTSVRDLGGDLAELQQWRKEIADGERIGPTVYFAGPYLESPANVARQRASSDVEPYERTRWPIGSADEADAAVARIADAGAHLVKVRTIQSQEEFRAIVAAARARGLKVATHPNDLTVEGASELAVGSVEHFSWTALDEMSPEAQTAGARRLIESGVGVTPTLVVFDSMLRVSPQMHAQALDQLPAEWDDPRNLASAYLIADWREQLAERTFPIDGIRTFVERHKGAYSRLREAGVAFYAGTDLGVLGIYPDAIHRELELLVEQLGFTPAEALRAATIGPAQFFGAGDATGSIAEGKIADAFLTTGNPLEDISQSANIRAVVLRGQYLSEHAMLAIKRDVSQSPVLRQNDWPR